jgi:hypothetical protein
MARPASHVFRLFLALVVVALGGVRSLSHALTINEAGFAGTLLTSDLSKQVEIGVPPGGVGDSCIYYGTFDGLTRRCNPFLPGTVCDPNLTFPVGLAFSTGGSFGNYMYVADYGINDIHRSVGCSVSTVFATLPGPGSIAFPPSGSAYGDYLYACTAFDGPIYRVSSTGVVTSWNALETTYIRFGPGGAWGTGLYATDNANVGNNRIVKVSSAGAVTQLATGIFFAEGFDWGFDGDMFATDMSAGQILRIKSNGAKTVFASLDGAADIAYRASEDALYVVSNQGGLYRIVRGSSTDVASGGRTLSRLAVTPNPTLGSCTLDFAIVASGLTRVDIVDVSGRIVRRLSDSWRSAGDQSVVWDGRDESGARARPGAYFARVRGARETQSARVSLVN